MDAHIVFCYTDIGKGGVTMAYIKAGMKAVDKYVRENYARLNIKIPKAQKEAVEARALEVGESVNGYVNGLIRADMGLTEDEWKNTSTE